jgi:hypothetical protein
VSSQLAKAKLDFKVAAEQHNIIKAELENQMTDYKQRRKMWIRRLKDNVKVIERHFHIYLQRKGFGGTLDFEMYSYIHACMFINIYIYIYVYIYI